MWACASGHRDVVALLAQWDPSAMNINDKSGQSVAAVARQRGHTALAEELETRRILTVRARSTAPTDPTVFSARSAPKMGVATESVTSRQMLMAKRSSVDSISAHSNNNDVNCWRKPPAAKGHKLSRFSSFSLALSFLSSCTHILLLSTTYYYLLLLLTTTYYYYLLLASTTTYY